MTLTLIIKYMLYSVADYQKKFFPDKKIRTVYRMIKSGSLPEGHSIIFISRVLLIDTSPNMNYYPYISAVSDYCKKKKIPVDLELSTECGIRHNVDSIKLLNEILGL